MHHARVVNVHEVFAKSEAVIRRQLAGGSPLSAAHFEFDVVEMRFEAELTARKFC